MFWVIFGLIILGIAFSPIVLYSIFYFPYMMETVNDFLSKVQIQVSQNSVLAIILMLAIFALMLFTLGCFVHGFFGVPLELKKRRKYNKKIKPIFTDEGLEDLAKEGRLIRTCFFILCFILWFIITHLA